MCLFKTLSVPVAERDFRGGVFFGPVVDYCIVLIKSEQ